MIDPLLINTIRVGQLVETVFSGTDKIPHEVGTDLRSGTINDLAVYVAGLIEATTGIAFLPISVTDGQLLPDTTSNEWFLAGKGTYTQTGGYPDIVATEELNVIVGNGTFWILGVAIPIIVDPPAAMISQTITEGVLNYSPSEDAVYDALQDLVQGIQSVRYAGLGQDYVIPVGATALKGWINDGVQHLEMTGFESDLNTFTQTSSTVTFKKSVITGARVIIDYYF